MIFGHWTRRLRRGIGLTLPCSLSIACGSSLGVETDAAGTGGVEAGGEPCSGDLDCPGQEVCVEGICAPSSPRRPYRDSWREELQIPVEGLTSLRIGGREVADNFANRGDIEVVYAEGASEIRVELQRFTIAESEAEALEHFSRMAAWAYALAVPEPPSEAIAGAACELGVEGCALRVYYDGLVQPLRDGANIRVTVPAGWPGALELETEDNLGEAGYPDRGDVRVIGLAGHLHAVLDSGRAEIRLEPDYHYYPGCPSNDECAASGLVPGCGCSEFGRVEVEARPGQAAEILVDLGSADKYASARLASADTQLELGCEIAIECEDFVECELESADLDTPSLERAALNYPGPPTVPGTGIHVDLSSGSCAALEHAEHPSDFLLGPPAEVRGSVRLCFGCVE